MVLGQSYFRLAPSTPQTGKVIKRFEGLPLCAGMASTTAALLSGPAQVLICQTKSAGSYGAGPHPIIE
jgi:hypothetical protein